MDSFFTRVRGFFKRHKDKDIFSISSLFIDSLAYSDLIMIKTGHLNKREGLVVLLSLC